MKFYLANWNDAGKIWIYKNFQLEAEEQYKVQVEFYFASSDFGDFNLWKLIGGAGSDEPDTETITKNVLDNTGNGLDEAGGYRWMTKEYTFQGSTDPDGKLYIYLGIWGTWETPRTYYMDDISLEIKKA